MAEDKISRLPDWGLDDSEKKNGRRTKGRDYGWRVIYVAESGAGRHDRFDEEDATEGADLSKSLDLES